MSQTFGGTFRKSALNLATFVGPVSSNYNMIFGPQNFSTSLIYPDNSAEAAWTFNASSATSGATMGPDNTNTGWHLTENSANTTHSFQPQPFHQLVMTDSTNIIYRVSCIAKAAERTRIVMGLPAHDQIIGDRAVLVGFDLAGVQTGYDNSTDAGWTILNQSITQIHNGWCLCQFDAVLSVAGNTHPFIFNNYIIYIDNGSGTAARSTTYTGNGTSGVYVWWVGCLPKAMLGITRTDFFDDFKNGTANIDTLNTQANGFTWYPAAYWSNASPSISGFNQWTNQPTTFLPLANYSVNNSILTITQGVGSNVGLWTATDAPNTDSGYFGRAWKLPAIFETSIAFGTSPSPGVSASPLMWTESLEMLLGHSTTFIEMDMPDSGTGADGGNWGFLQWDVLGFPRSNYNSWQYGGSGRLTGFGPPVANTGQHRYSTAMWTPFENDGVWGGGMHFFDGCMCAGGDIHFSPTQAFTTSSAGNAAVGAWSNATWHHWPLIVATGATSPGWPGLFDYVRVYRPPTGNPANLSSASITGNTATTVSVSVTTNVGNGAIYYVATTNSTPPTTTQVMGGKNGVGQSLAMGTYGAVPVNASGIQSFTITELLPSTAYNIFLTQEVNNGSLTPVLSALTVTTNAAGTYRGPGDQTVSDAIGWWGLRAYSSKTAGHKCLVVTRDSDNAYLQVSSRESDGLIDQTALGTFGTATTLRPSIVWNQSPGATFNRNGLAISTFTGLGTVFPTITLNAINSKPTFVYTLAAASQLGSLGQLAAISQPFTISTIVERTGHFTTLTTFERSTTFTDAYLSWNGVANTLVLNAGTDLTATAADSAYHRVQAVANSTSSNLYVDGSNNTGNAGVLGIPANFLATQGFGTGFSTDANMLEVGIWGYAFSGTELSNMDANQAAYI